MATHSRTLAWRIPGVAEPGGLPSMGSHRSDLVAAAGLFAQDSPELWVPAGLPWADTSQACIWGRVGSVWLLMRDGSTGQPHGVSSCATCISSLRTRCESPLPVWPGDLGVQCTPSPLTLPGDFPDGRGSEGPSTHLLAEKTLQLLLILPSTLKPSSASEIYFWYWQRRQIRAVAQYRRLTRSGD